MSTMITYHGYNNPVYNAQKAVDVHYTQQNMVILCQCVGNHSKCGKCGSAPTQKSQWGARLVGRTHVHR